MTMGIVGAVAAVIGAVAAIVAATAAILQGKWAKEETNRQFRAADSANRAAHDAIGKNIDQTRNELGKRIDTLDTDTKKLIEDVGYLREGKGV